MEDDGSITLDDGSATLASLMEHCDSERESPAEDCCGVCNLVIAARALLSQHMALRAIAQQLMSAHYVGHGRFVAPKKTMEAIRMFRHVLGMEDTDSD